MRAEGARAAKKSWGIVAQTRLEILVLVLRRGHKLCMTREQISMVFAKSVTT